MSEASVDPEWAPLAEGESVRWVGGPRIQRAYPWLAVGALGLAVGVLAALVEVVPLALILVTPLALLTAGWGWLSVTRVAFLVTTEALYARRGVLGVHVTTVPIDRVQNSEYAQHALGRALGYGTVRIDTAGGGDLAFWAVEDPREVAATVEASVDAGGEYPGSLEQWEAVRREVGRIRQALES